MRIAIDSATDRPIFAADVLYHQADEEFLCPCCGKNVMFIPQRIQQPHFRHWPNVTDEACIEYVGADSSKLAGFLLEYHLENNRQITIGIATKEIYIGALTTLEWFPFARFRPKEGNRAIRCLNPALPSLLTAPPKARFIPLEKIQHEYTFRIENVSGPSRDLKIPGFNRQRMVFRHLGGFWAMLDSADHINAGDFLVLSQDDFSLKCPPPGIEVTLRGSRPGNYLLGLTIAQRVTQKMAAFCLKEFGHRLSQKGFDCSILTAGIALNLGPTIWQLPPGQAVNILLRSGSTSEEIRHLVFESACDKTRTQQSLSFFGHSAVLALGILKPGRHILACVDSKEIIAVFEVSDSDEVISIPAVQINVKRTGQTRCFYWASKGLADALLEVRTGTAEIDRLILPFDLCLEARSTHSSSPALISNREQFTNILRSAKSFNEIKVTSQVYHIRGFSTISLVLPKSVAFSEMEHAQQKTLYPRTPFHTSLVDAVRRGILPRYALSSIGARP
jgi:hypothetical protein